MCDVYLGCDRHTCAFVGTARSLAVCTRAHTRVEAFFFSNEIPFLSVVLVFHLLSSSLLPAFLVHVGLLQYQPAARTAKDVPTEISEKLRTMYGFVLSVNVLHAFKMS